MCHKKPYNEKKNNNNNKNSKQNINKQPPTCTCPSINKLTAGALVICKKNRYAHWQVQNTVHGSQVQVFALLINNRDKQLTPPSLPPLWFFLPLSGKKNHKGGREGGVNCLCMGATNENSHFDLGV